MIYFDNAATTPLCTAARERLLQDYANPSSPHILGLESERALKGAAKDMAQMLSCHSDELIFTSGGTESNNIGILGAALALQSARGNRNRLHIMAGRQEHPSVLEPLAYLSSLPGFSIGHEMQEDTAMICISQVSSETGDIFKVQKPPGVLLFVDGAQAFCKIPHQPQADIYTFSGHKFHGPMGVGGLMIKRGLRIAPLTYGGGQQSGRRPGTENVPGILAMVAAAKEMQAADIPKILNIKNIMSSLAEEVPETHINQATDFSSPFILNMSFLGIKGETLTNMLSSEGLCVSMGTACRSAKKETGLSAAGFSKERAESAIRMSFSIMNTVEEAGIAKDLIKSCVAKLRSTGRRK